MSSLWWFCFIFMVWRSLMCVSGAVGSQSRDSVWEPVSLWQKPLSQRSPAASHSQQGQTVLLVPHVLRPSVRRPSSVRFMKGSVGGRVSPAEFWETESCLEGLSSPSTPSWQNFTRELMQLKYFSVKRSTKTRPTERTKGSVYEPACVCTSECLCKTANYCMFLYFCHECSVPSVICAGWCLFGSSLWTEAWTVSTVWGSVVVV